MFNFLKPKNWLVIACFFYTPSNNAVKAINIVALRKKQAPQQANSTEEFLSNVIQNIITKKNAIPNLSLNKDASLEDICQYYKTFSVDSLPAQNMLATFNLSKSNIGTLLAIFIRDLSFTDEHKIFYDLRSILELIKKPSTFPSDEQLFSYLPSAYFSTTQCRLLLKLILQRALLINGYNLIMTKLENDEFLSTTPDLNANNYQTKLELLLKLQMLRLNMPPSSINNQTVKFRKPLSNENQPTEKYLPSVIDSFDDDTASLFAMQINTSFENIETLFFKSKEQPNNNYPLKITPKSSDCLNFMLSSMWLGHQINISIKTKPLGTCALSIPYERLDSPDWNSSEALMSNSSFISMKKIVDAFLKRFSELKNSTPRLKKTLLFVTKTINQLESLNLKLVSFEKVLKSEIFDIEVQNENLLPPATKKTT